MVGGGGEEEVVGGVQRGRERERGGKFLARESLVGELHRKPTAFVRAAGKVWVTTAIVQKEALGRATNQEHFE